MKTFIIILTVLLFAAGIVWHRYRELDEFRSDASVGYWVKFRLKGKWTSGQVKAVGVYTLVVLCDNGELHTVYRSYIYPV